MSTDLLKWRRVIDGPDGTRIEVYSVGALAKEYSKSVATIRMWIKLGVIPSPDFVGSQGEALYTMETIGRVRTYLWKIGKVDFKLSKHKNRPITVVRTVRFQDGSMVRMRLYRVGELAKVMGRTAESVRNAIKRGGIPDTPLTTSDLKQRLYTLDMMAVVGREFKRRGKSIRSQKEWVDLAFAIQKGWDKLGIKGAEVVK